MQISRRNETCEATTLRGLYPAGEGAGYAGGIVSAAVDGLRVARALLQAAPLERPSRGEGENRSGGREGLDVA